MKQNSYYLISLGCAKNTVDSHSMSAILDLAGYEPAPDIDNAEVLIVNTCGFINPAREESIAVLKELSDLKQKNQILIAGGCLTQRFPEMIINKLPEVDGIFGTRRWMDIVEVLSKVKSQNSPTPYQHTAEIENVGADEKGVIRTAIQGGSAYLKIADGCRRNCAFCAIPLIKGTTVSRPTKDILRDVEALQNYGIKELILIAQDTTDYGFDIGVKDGLSALLAQILRVAPDIPWIRILYNYPGYVTDRLIELMANNPQILPYFDLPLQHADPAILKRMNRPSDVNWVYKTIAKLRAAISDLAIRTTFVVGFPGETEKEFDSLLNFIKELRFDHVGVFPYSHEKGTPAERFGDPISEKIKLDRVRRLMSAQETISYEKNQLLVGKEMEILIEGSGDGISVGRTYRDAPEIDGLVILDNEAPIGDFVRGKIIGAMVHDLTAKILK